MANLNINFVGSKKKLHNQMLREFEILGRKALTMNHYDFAVVTSVHDPQDWKEFLQIPPVSEYITEEFNAIQDSELRKLIMNISDSSSVGKAQLINAMQKQLKENENSGKTGPAFIYCYVPLNDEEINADNVEVLDRDPFKTQ